MTDRLIVSVFALSERMVARLIVATAAVLSVSLLPSFLWRSEQEDDEEIADAVSQEAVTVCRCQTCAVLSCCTTVK
jgi:hypothetical protein